MKTYIMKNKNSVTYAKENSIMMKIIKDIKNITR